MFDLKPKESRAELFGRERELGLLHRLTRSEWVVVLGRRMSGKTSLLKTFLREVGGVYVNLMGVGSIKGLAYELAKAVKSVRLEFDLRVVRVSWTRLAEDIFARLDGRVVGLDEVQELPANYFLKLLKKLWDTYNIRLVMTGSMMGVLDNLLEPGPGSPMYGRAPAVLRLEPFSREQSYEFLVKGFEECGLRVSKGEVEEAVELLDGYPGWLTYYGNYRCVRGYGHREALEQVYLEGRRVMQEELEMFLRNKRLREKYLDLLRNLPARWSELERKMGVNRKILSSMLKSLEKAMLIKKIGRTYTITDPVLRRLVLEL